MYEPNMPADDNALPSTGAPADVSAGNAATSASMAAASAAAAHAKARAALVIAIAAIVIVAIIGCTLIGVFNN